MHLLHYLNRIYEKLFLLIFDLFSFFSINHYIILLFYIIYLKHFFIIFSLF